MDPALNESQHSAKMTPLRFSVILPAHRADEFLKVAIESAERAVGAHDGELIVVANGAERHRVAAFAERTRKLALTRVVVSEIPSLIYCLNRGIDLACGEYIARFDSDDVCLAHRLDQQYQLAERTGAHFIFSAAEVIDEHGAATGQIRQSDISLWKRCGPIHPTAFIKRDALLQLGGYGNLEFSEDYHLWMRAQSEGMVFHIDALPAIKYRVHSQQATDKSKLADTFATNLGLKMIIGIRKRNSRILVGAAFDAACLVYRKCLDAFS